MKKYLVLLLFSCMAIPAFGQDKFAGDWENKDEKLTLRIYEVDSEYYAKVTAAQNLENIGKIVLIQMRKKSDHLLVGGTYYDFGLKSEYEAKLKLVDNNTILVKVLSGFFNKTIIWHRPEPVEGQEETNRLTAATKLK